MRAIGIRQARAELGDLVINAHTRQEATIITRYGEPWAAIVPANRAPATIQDVTALCPTPNPSPATQAAAWHAVATQAGYETEIVGAAMDGSPLIEDSDGTRYVLTSHQGRVYAARITTLIRTSEHGREAVEIRDNGSEVWAIHYLDNEGEMVRTGESVIAGDESTPGEREEQINTYLVDLAADGYADCDDAGPLPRVEISPVTEPDELYHQVPGEDGPQPVYVELDLETSTLSATYDPEVGTMPMRPREVVYGLVRRYPIPPLTADAANRIMAQIRPYADRICADWAQHWDGEKHIAVLGDDARAAEAALLAHLGDQDDWGDWDPADLVGGIPADLSEISDMVSADTTDSELDDLVAQIMADLAEAEPSGVVTSEAEDVIRDYLVEARDDA